MSTLRQHKPGSDTTMRAVAFATYFLAFSCSAQTMVRLTTASPIVTVGSEVEFVVEFEPVTESPLCGLNITFGDNLPRRIRVGQNGMDDIPLRIRHTFDVPGIHKVAVEGALIIEPSIEGAASAVVRPANIFGLLQSLTQSLVPATPCFGPALAYSVTVRDRATQARQAQSPLAAQPTSNQPAQARSSGDEDLEQKQRKLDELEAQLRQREQQLAQRTATAPPRAEPVAVAASPAPVTREAGQPTAPNPAQNVGDIRQLLDQVANLTGIQASGLATQSKGTQYSGSGRVENVLDDQTCEVGSRFRRCAQLILLSGPINRVVINLPSPAPPEFARLNLGDTFSFKNCALVSLSPRRAVCDFVQ
jgi:hypothetical protein